MGCSWRMRVPCLGGTGPSVPSHLDGRRCSAMACRGQRSPRPGHTGLGGGGALPRRWLLVKEGLRGGGQQSPRPGHTSLKGRGVLPRCGCVFNEGLRRATVPKVRAHQAEGIGSPAQAVVDV